MQLLGLHGFAQVGKDTAGLHLTSGRGFTRYSFADPIREALYTLDPMLDGTVSLAMLLDKLDGDWDAAKNHRVYGAEVRRLMQKFGTEVARDLFGPDVWIKVAAAAIAEDRPDAAVITDVRFTEEAEWINAQGGQVIEITRPGVLRINGHSSENGLPRELISATIANDGSRTVLAHKLDAALNLTPALANAA
ncbi:hypothetical protein [Arthrobacter sp. H14]|uniref:deoxynucleotide monophosphate kinase family protein n=1 Tax=Arthrobacter sp. H14 TaxID=1312959 RepID=UPI0004BB54C0|nr:hypothetical protein [Arthrobacter sp. H14]